jgi:hypothetical protein
VAIKRRVKGAVKFVSNFEQRLVKHARSRGCDGVICGHIHTPTVTKYGGITYCSAGAGGLGTDMLWMLITYPAVVFFFCYCEGSKIRLY